MTFDVSVVIVTYNSASVISRCLQATADCDEVVVVDNASVDNTCEVIGNEFPAVKLIRNPDNRGFATATNQGIHATRCPFVLLLNPDAVLKTSVEPLVEECLQPGVGAAAGRLLDENGQHQAGFNVRRLPTATTLAFEVLGINHVWPSNPINRRYRCLGFDPRRPQEVEQPAGAFLMVRRDVLDQIGYLDERFHPLWFEDVDLCMRIRQAGHAIHYVPASKAGHSGAHSIPALDVRQRHLAWYGNLLRCSYKHFPKWTYRRLHAAVVVGVVCRWLLCLLGARTSRECAAYREVIRVVADTHTFQGARAAIPVESTSPAAYKSS